MTSPKSSSVSSLSGEIESRLKESIRTKEEVLKTLVPTIEKAAHLLIETLRSGGKVLLFGNGGSAADSQHLAAELVGRMGGAERRALPAIALTTDTSNLTAIANDFGYEAVFKRQVEALGRPGDVAIGISTSGTSPNVVAGLRKAKEMGLKTLALTGRSGGPAAELADIAVRVPSDSTQRIQESHITIGQILCEIVEARCARS